MQLMARGRQAQGTQKYGSLPHNHAICDQQPATSMNNQDSAACQQFSKQVESRSKGITIGLQERPRATVSAGLDACMPAPG